METSLEAPQQPSYIFPDFLAKAMAKVDQRTQLEGSMMSMSFMSIGLIITITYLVIYFDFALWYKIALVINGLAGLLFMSSYLITTFQQYRNHMEILEFQEQREKQIHNQDALTPASSSLVESTKDRGSSQDLPVNTIEKEVLNKNNGRKERRRV